MNTGNATIQGEVELAGSFMGRYWLICCFQAAVHVNTRDMAGKERGAPNGTSVQSHRRGVLRRMARAFQGGLAQVVSTGEASQSTGPSKLAR